MEKNVGGYERIARIALGISLLVLGRRARRTPAAGLARRLAGRSMAMVGLNMLGTALAQRCPANSMFGRNSFIQDDGDVVDTVSNAIDDRSQQATQ